MQVGETLYEAVKQGQEITYSKYLEQLVNHIFIQLPTRSSSALKVPAVDNSLKIRVAFWPEIPLMASIKGAWHLLTASMGGAA